jgi:hypothetical protein
MLLKTDSIELDQLGDFSINRRLCSVFGCFEGGVLLFFPS